MQYTCAALYRITGVTYPSTSSLNMSYVYDVVQKIRTPTI